MVLFNLIDCFTVYMKILLLHRIAKSVDPDTNAPLGSV